MKRAKKMKRGSLVIEPANNMCSINESNKAAQVSPAEHAERAIAYAISLHAGRQNAEHNLAIPEADRAVFLLGWAACAEAVRSAR